MMRLDKYLADCGVGTRSEIKAILRQGRVTVDGQPAKRPEAKVSPGQEILLDGVPAVPRGSVVLMLHKPGGYVTSTSDPRDKTVMELLPPDYQDLFPVGRLDKDTEGLLLLTNDGPLAHRLTSPKYEIEKEYYAETDGAVDEADILAFREGIVLRDGTRCKPAELVPADGGCHVILCEGKYHQVRRMLASRGKPVLYLKRIREGALSLGDLPRGAFRPLTPEERKGLE